MDRVQKKGEDYGYGEVIATVDTIILGRKTYDWVLSQVKSFPDEGKEILVTTEPKTKSR